MPRIFSCAVTLLCHYPAFRSCCALNFFVRTPTLLCLRGFLCALTLLCPNFFVRTSLLCAIFFFVRSYSLVPLPCFSLTFLCTFFFRAQLRRCAIISLFAYPAVGNFFFVRSYLAECAYPAALLLCPYFFFFAPTLLCLYFFFFAPTLLCLYFLRT